MVTVREGPGWMLRFDIGGSFAVIPEPTGAGTPLTVAVGASRARS
jgi:hypothetical protein